MAGEDDKTVETVTYYQLEKDGLVSFGFTSQEPPFGSRPLSENRYNELIGKMEEKTEEAKQARDAELEEALEVRKAKAESIVEKIISGEKLTSEEADILVERLS